MRALIAAVVAALAGCQGGEGERGAPAAGGDAGAPANRDAAIEPPADAAGDEPGAVDPSAATAPGQPPEVEDFDAAVERLGAIPAWRAVIERDRLLARRGDRGVVFGRVGSAVPPPAAPAPVAADPDAGPPPPPPTGLTWLVDETQGGGALAIRVRFGADAPAEGARVAVRGAWVVDDARRWVWAADAVTALPAAADDDGATAPPLPPGLVVATAAPPVAVEDVRTPDVAATGDVVRFTVLGPPVKAGDGWPVSDRRGGPLHAYVVLPGEAEAYGGHDLRSADERWPLATGGTYWVKAGKVRRRGEQPAVIEATTPPARFP